MLALHLLAGFLAARQHVNDRVLDERTEHEHQTGGHPHVDRLGERDRRHAAQVPRTLRRDRQHRQNTERYTGGHRLEVDPEGDPRQQNDEHAR